MARNFNVVGGRNPGKYFSLPHLPPEVTSTVSQPGGIRSQCSRHECNEHCSSHSDRGHGSEGRPYFLWPITSVLLVGVWDRPTVTYLQIWGEQTKFPQTTKNTPAPPILVDNFNKYSPIIIRHQLIHNHIFSSRTRQEATPIIPNGTVLIIS